MPSSWAITLSDCEAGLRAWRLWIYRGWAEVRRRYERTLLGPGWHTISLGVFIGVMGVLWSAVFHIRFESYVPYLAAGMISWGLISHMVLEGAALFGGIESSIKSIRIPYSVFAYSFMWRNVIIFFHQVILMVLIWIAVGMHLGPGTLLLPLGVAIVLVNGLWLALVLGPICLRYPDLQVLTGSLMQLAFFVTPIFWPRDLLGSELSRFVDYTPLFHWLEIIRKPLLGVAPEPVSWLVAALTAIFGLALAGFVFGRTRARVPYWY